MNIQVSVVIPTRNRPALLARTLQALRTQEFDPACYEVLVVDDGPHEATRLVTERRLNQFPFGPRVRYLAMGSSGGPAAARNLGWQAAAGEVIAFTDDDTIPTRDWLKHGLAALQDACADGASGRVIVPLGQQPTDYEVDAAGLERSRFVTANCFYRRSALQELGGFDEAFALAWREDSDLYFRMLARGLRLVDAPQAIVIHPVRPARWGVCLQQQRKSMFNALLYKKHPQLYRSLQTSPPWLYYLALVSFFGAGLALLGGLPQLAAGLGGAWAALWLSFSRRRLQGTSHSPAHVAEMLVTSALIPFLSVYWRLRGALRYRVFFL
ncbi:MAG: glycosyltransferase family 2 protein [Chloroflexota bacterium]